MGKTIKEDEDLELNISAAIADRLQRCRRILNMDFDIIVYLRGRREYLKAQSGMYISDSSKAKCAQARLSEICELLMILETQKGGDKSDRPT